MISHRLRTLATGVPLALASVLLATSPAVAVDALRIVTPLAGTTLTGPLTAEGTVVSDRPVEVVIGLAPQLLGDCGAVAVSSTVIAAGDFVVSIPTAGLADGTYCLVAVADAGRLSTVVADIAVRGEAAPALQLDGLQLSTEPLGGGADVSGPALGAGLPLSVPGAAVLGAAVLGGALALALGVLAAGLWARRSTAH